MFLFKQGKALMSVVLAAHLLAGSVYSVGAANIGVPLTGTPYTAGGYDVTVPHVVVHQAYGAGLKTDSGVAVSHGFIELYNQSDSDVDLSGWSLHYADRGSNKQTGETLDWVKLDLAGTIKAKSSYLIKGKATGADQPKLDLTNKGDQDWDIFLNNKGMKVVLMSNQQPLDNERDINPFQSRPDGYVDMLGTASNDSGSDIDGYETDYPTGDAEGTSKKKAVRRVDFQDTDNNKIDFKQVDYDGANAADLTRFSPRDGSDEGWGEAPEPLVLNTSSLPVAYKDQPYSAQLAASGGISPYRFEAQGLPQGIELSENGAITGTPAALEQGAAVKFTVTDSGNPQQSKAVELQWIVQPFRPLVEDAISIKEIASYSVGTSSSDGGVAEIVKFNKDNGKFYLVNGAANPPTLDIVQLGEGGGELSKVKSVLVKELAESGGFAFGDLTSVDINTATKKVYVAVQEADHMKQGKILALDYDGVLIGEYEAGVQPDMIKSTPDGKYVLTADEGEPRNGVDDPKGSVTIVDVEKGTSIQVYFDNPDVIDDSVHIRGAADPVDGIIKSKGSKEDALYDLEPEYITLSGDSRIAYVALQENNAIASINIAAASVLSVKSLGFKDLNKPGNELDLRRDNQVMLENAPFYGVYMPDGIASHRINGVEYLFTANEGDATGWSNRSNEGTIGGVKGLLDPTSAAASFLNGTTVYDKVEFMTDMGNDGIYLYGGRSFSIWNAASMEQVYDSGSDFELITGQRFPDYFNVSNSKIDMDDRSTKKGPEPEDIKVGVVGNRVLAFVGLERVGGFMTYDVTNPASPSFVNYSNKRVFKNEQGKVNLNTFTGPEGLEFIPAEESPTGQPLLLVAYEVGGMVGVYQLEVAKVTLNASSLSLTAGGSTAKLTAEVVPAGGGAASVVWSSSNAAIATVNVEGVVTPVAAGSAVITVSSADGYGIAKATVTVNAASSGSGPIGPIGNTANPQYEIDAAGGTDAGVIIKVSTITSQGKTASVLDEAGVKEALALLDKASPQEAGRSLKMEVQGQSGNGAVLSLGAGAMQLLGQGELTRLVIATQWGDVTFDEAAIRAWAEAAGKKGAELSVAAWDAASAGGQFTQDIAAELRDKIGNRPAVQVHMTAGGEAVSNWKGGKASLQLPYKSAIGEESNAIVVYYVADNGTMTVVPNASYDAAAGSVSFQTGHFSTYAVGYNKISYSDTLSSFASGDITFLSARGILQGVGHGEFKPKGSMNRGDFALVLSRIAGVSLDSFRASRFADVSPSDYFGPSVEWAAEAGITNGIGGGAFQPKGTVTREQAATMLMRLAKTMGLELPKTGVAATFSDADTISDYAREAVQALQQAGILEGKSTGGAIVSDQRYFAPQDLLTREESAKLMTSFMVLLQK